VAVHFEAESEQNLGQPSPNGGNSLIRVAFVANSSATVTHSELVDWSDCRKVCISEHFEQPKKDGVAFIFADLHGGRRDENADSVSALVYDIDGKLTEPEADRIVAETGFEAVHYTTFNHLKTVTTVGVKSYQKWAQANGYGKNHRPPRQSMRAYCAAHPKYNHLTHVRLLDNGRTIRVKLYDSEFDACRIGHDPEHKTRVIFPLLRAIPVKVLGIDVYKAIYHAVGTKLFADRYDRACSNPARLHYLPSHPPGATGYVIKHHSGELLDWEATYKPLKAEIEKHREQSAKRREVWANTPSQDLAELHRILKSIPSYILRDQWFRALAAIFHETKDSDEGRQLAHSWSERDDDRYDYDEVEAIWGDFDPDHPHPATMGTLIKLAQEHDAAFDIHKLKVLQAAQWFARAVEDTNG
jgi:hypothetical protein